MLFQNKEVEYRDAFLILALLLNLANHDYNSLVRNKLKYYQKQVVFKNKKLSNEIVIEKQVCLKELKFNYQVHQW